MLRSHAVFGDLHDLVGRGGARFLLMGRDFQAARRGIRVRKISGFTSADREHERLKVQRMGIPCLLLPCICDVSQPLARTDLEGARALPGRLRLPGQIPPCCLEGAPSRPPCKTLEYSQGRTRSGRFIPWARCQHPEPGGLPVFAADQVFAFSIKHLAGSLAACSRTCPQALGIETNALAAPSGRFMKVVRSLIQTAPR